MSQQGPRYRRSDTVQPTREFERHRQTMHSRAAQLHRQSACRPHQRALLGLLHIFLVVVVVAKASFISFGRGRPIKVICTKCRSFVSFVPLWGWALHPHRTASWHRPWGSYSFRFRLTSQQWVSEWVNQLSASVVQWHCNLSIIHCSKFRSRPRNPLFGCVRLLLLSVPLLACSHLSL